MRKSETDTTEPIRHAYF